MAPRILIHKSMRVVSLVAMGAIWLVLLQITSFNAVTVGLGLLFALGVMA